MNIIKHNECFFININISYSYSKVVWGLSHYKLTPPSQKFCSVSSFPLCVCVCVFPLCVDFLQVWSFNVSGLSLLSASIRPVDMMDCHPVYHAPTPTLVPRIGSRFTTTLYVVVEKSRSTVYSSAHEINIQYSFLISWPFAEYEDAEIYLTMVYCTSYINWAMKKQFPSICTL